MRPGLGTGTSAHTAPTDRSTLASHRATLAATRNAGSSDVDVDLLRQQVHLADFGQTLGQSIRHTVRVLGECSAAADAPLVRALEQLCESGMDGRATLDYLRDAETGIVPTFLRPAHELAEVCRRRLESIVQGGDGSLREEGGEENGTDRKT